MEKEKREDKFFITSGVVFWFLMFVFGTFLVIGFLTGGITITFE